MQIFIITHLQLWFQVNSQNPITAVPKSNVARNGLCKVLKLILSTKHTWDSTWFQSHPPDYITQHWKKRKKPLKYEAMFRSNSRHQHHPRGRGFKSSAPPRVSTCNLGAFTCLLAHVLGEVPFAQDVGVFGGLFVLGACVCVIDWGFHHQLALWIELFTWNWWN